jgi:uncharacterized membrane protein YbhN (UPF0104 family)
MTGVLHDIGVFFHHLADVGWTALGIALACQFVKLCCVSRAWRNILAASYPEARVRWRSIFGAVLARVGVNAIVPARGGDALGLFIVKRRIEGSRYPTLGATLVALTLFDSVVASCFIVYALIARELPGSSVLARLHAFDFHWFFAHLRGTLIVLGVILLLLLLLLLWFAEQLIGFRERVAQGFAVFSDKTYYLRRVAVWQVADWSLRLVMIYFFLRAFHVPATLHNAILVQVTQSLAVLFPISPSGIGTEQALLLYTFAGKAAKSVLLSFSVGMRVTLIVFNALLGFGSIVLMLRTLRWRQRVEADRAVTEQ